MLLRCYKITCSLLLAASTDVCYKATFLALYHSKYFLSLFKNFSVPAVLPTHHEEADSTFCHLHRATLSQDFQFVSDY